MRRLLRRAGLGAVLATAGCSTGGEPNGDGPVLLAISPNATFPHGSQMDIIVAGTNFQAGAVVTWNGSERTTQFSSSTELFARIPGTDLDQPDTAQVRVRNPDGRISGLLPFRVAPNAVPFGIDSIRPSNGEDASLAEPVTVYFNEALQPGSIHDSLVTISTLSTEIPATVTYLPGQRALQISAAFAPVTRYLIAVAPGIRSESGGGLLTPLTTVVFTTRAAFARLSPLSGSVSAALSGNGGPVLAFTYSNLVTQINYAATASCTANCTSSTGWTRNLSDAGPQAGYLMALAMAGTTPVMTWESGSIRYSLGGSNSVLVDAGNSDVTWPSIAYAAGRNHVVYYGGGDVKHASCTAGCLTSGNWSIDTVDQTGNSGAYSDVVVDNQGTVHAVYLENAEGDLRYARCSSNCVTPDWTSTVVDSAGYVGEGADLALAADGSVHVVYIDHTRGVARYGRCAAGCDTMGNWTVTDVTTPGEAVATQAAIATGSGSVDIVFQQANTGHVYSLSCTSGCDTAAGWQRSLLAMEASSGGFDASLVVDAAGVRHLLWSQNSIKYMQY